MTWFTRHHFSLLSPRETSLSKLSLPPANPGKTLESLSTQRAASPATRSHTVCEMELVCQNSGSEGPAVLNNPSHSLEDTGRPCREQEGRGCTHIFPKGESSQEEGATVAPPGARKAKAGIKHPCGSRLLPFQSPFMGGVTCALETGAERHVPSPETVSGRMQKSQLIKRALAQHGFAQFSLSFLK